MIESFIINPTLFVGITVGIILTGVVFKLVQKFGIHTLEDLKDPVNLVIVSGIILFVVGLPYVIPAPVFLDYSWLSTPLYFLGLLLVIMWVVDLE